MTSKEAIRPMFSVRWIEQKQVVDTSSEVAQLDIMFRQNLNSSHPSGDICLGIAGF